MQVGLNTQAGITNINKNKEAQTNSINKLASAKKEESVDPAIAMIAEAMMSGVIIDAQGVQNANIASGMMQIADGTLSQVGDMNSKLQELSVASNNAALSSSDKSILKTEFNSTIDSINSALSDTTFNGKQLFGQDMSFSIGGSDINISLQDINSSNLDINSQDSIDDFTKQINSAKSNIGSTQNAIQSSADNLTNQMIQKSDAKSQMSDVDIAKEISKYKDGSNKLNASELTQAHQNNISAQKVATLLE